MKRFDGNHDHLSFTNEGFFQIFWIEQVKWYTVLTDCNFEIQTLLDIGYSSFTR